MKAYELDDYGLRRCGVRVCAGFVVSGVRVKGFSVLVGSLILVGVCSCRDSGVRVWVRMDSCGPRFLRWRSS